MNAAPGSKLAPLRNKSSAPPKQLRRDSQRQHQVKRQLACQDAEIRNGPEQ